MMSKEWKMAGFLGVYSRPNTECSNPEGCETSLGIVMKDDKPIGDYVECCVCESECEPTHSDIMSVLYHWNSDYADYTSVHRYLIDKYGEPEYTKEYIKRLNDDWDGEMNE